MDVWFRRNAGEGWKAGGREVLNKAREGGSGLVIVLVHSLACENVK